MPRPQPLHLRVCGLGRFIFRDQLISFVMFSCLKKNWRDGRTKWVEKVSNVLQHILIPFMSIAQEILIRRSLVSFAGWRNAKKNLRQVAFSLRQASKLGIPASTICRRFLVRIIWPLSKLYNRMESNGIESNRIRRFSSWTTAIPRYHRHSR